MNRRLFLKVLAAIPFFGSTAWAKDVPLTPETFLDTCGRILPNENRAESDIPNHPHIGRVIRELELYGITTTGGLVGLWEKYENQALRREKDTVRWMAGMPETHKNKTSGRYYRGVFYTYVGLIRCALIGRHADDPSMEHL